MSEHAVEIDALRRQYNAAVANGLLVQAKRIEHRMDALTRESTRVVPDEEAR